MRILHTSDWHLGRIFHGIHLTEEQAYLLEQFIAIAKESKPDVIVIAGDIYDRSVPPTEAINLLDEVITRILVDFQIPIIIIAGNHDSPDRLGFGSRLLQEKGLHIYGRFSPEIAKVVIPDTHGSVNFYPLTYAEPAIVRSELQEADLQGHDQSMFRLLERIRATLERGRRNVLISHSFVAGGEESESERPLAIGGSGAVNSAYFKDFAYVALGHLHQAQKIGAEHIRYSGSLMKYSFSEVNHRKSVTLIDLDKAGKTSIEKIELKPRHDLRKIEGYLQEILNNASKDGSRDDYLMVTLQDEGALLDPIGMLKSVYPNIMHIERLQYTGNKSLVNPEQNFRKLKETELFSSFFQQVADRELSAEQQKIFAGTVERYYSGLRGES